MIFSCYVTHCCISSVYLTLKIKIAFFFKKSLWNVWCVLKKCLPLHPLSERKRVFKEAFFDRFRYEQASSTGLYNFYIGKRKKPSILDRFRYG